MINASMRGENIMVRVGGGWVTLKEYLADKHHFNHSASDAGVRYGEHLHEKVVKGKEEDRRNGPPA